MVLSEEDSKKYINKLAVGSTRAFGDVDLDGGGLSKKDFHKLERTDYDLGLEKEQEKLKLYDAYMNIIDLLKKYCDLKEEYYPIIATWIIGTYLHEDFQSYPYLFLNAMRGSGKSRTLKLITQLSKGGEMVMSMTEAVLFRTKGTIGIDEFEGLTRRGNENLRELLNASYKKGTKVKRMRKKKTPDGEQQVVEEFDVYRPIVMANIWGMDEVLGDRCISLILERSNKREIVQLVEIWEQEVSFIETKKILDQCRLCSVVVPRKVYIEWNKYITENNTNTHTTHDTLNDTNYTQLFRRLNSLKINGRDLELMLPLLLISHSIDKKAFKKVFSGINDILSEKRQDQFAESRDVSLIDFVSQEPKEGFRMLKEVHQKFREFLQDDDLELDVKWTGRALKRLGLIKDKKRLAGGRLVILDIKKAQKKIVMFK